MHLTRIFFSVFLRMPTPSFILIFLPYLPPFISPRFLNSPFLEFSCFLSIFSILIFPSSLLPPFHSPLPHSFIPEPLRGKRICHTYRRENCGMSGAICSQGRSRLSRPRKASAAGEGSLATGLRYMHT